MELSHCPLIPTSAGVVSEPDELEAALATCGDKPAKPSRKRTGRRGRAGLTRARRPDAGASA